MVTKPVQIVNGPSFEKAGDAEKFFREIIQRWPKMVSIAGTDLDAVDALYRDYCVVTNWQMPGKPVRYYTDSNKGGTTSFYVEFDKAHPEDFSFKKAVREIANRK